jgi:Cohesin domain/PEP-CTERM motif
MRRRLLVATALGVALFVSSPARAASITFDSSLPSPIAQGSQFQLAIRVLDIADLFTFGFDLSFDSTVLEATSIAEGDFLPSAVTDPLGGTFFIPGTIIPGLVSLTTSSLFGETQLGATGDGVLALITFRALADGDSGLSLLNVFLADSTIPAGNPIAADVINGVVRVAAPTPVPEPSTLGLVGIGLAALARRLRRKAPVANQPV